MTNQSSLMTDEKPPTSYFSCAEVARRLGLSRQRFWQLRNQGVFPAPQHDEATGRPFYTGEQLELCLDLRKRNVGINGQVVLFYSVRSSSPAPRKAAKKRPAAPKAAGRYRDLIESLKALGLSSVTEGQVAEAISELFPSGIDQSDQGEVIRAVFLFLQRKN